MLSLVTISALLVQSHELLLFMHLISVHILSVCLCLCLCLPFFLAPHYCVSIFNSLFNVVKLVHEENT